MPKCAYCGNEINDNKTIVICKNGCNKTNFLCSCGFANRTTAFYCRFCGKEVSYDSALIRHTKSLKISHSVFENSLFELPFSKFGVSSEIVDLPKVYSSYGSLFLPFKTGNIIILNSGNGEIQHTVDLQSKILSLPIEVYDGMSKSLFIFASDKLYRIDLIRDFDCETVMKFEEKGAELNLQPLYFDGHFLSVFRQNSVNYIKLISFDGNHKNIISLNDIVSQPVKTGNKALFYTKNKIFIYDHSEKGIVYEGENSYHFSTEVEPKSAGNRVYVLTSEEKLFRINLDEEVPEIFGLPHPQLMQMCFEVTEDQIIIVHSRGVLITNVLGQTEWSSDELLGLYPAYKFPPTSFGKYIAFVMSYPNMEVLHIIETDNFRQVSSYSGNFVFRPMYYDGNLYIVVEENGEVIMRAYEL